MTAVLMTVFVFAMAATAVGLAAHSSTWGWTAFLVLIAIKFAACGIEGDE